MSLCLYFNFSVQEVLVVKSFALSFFGYDVSKISRHGTLSQAAKFSRGFSPSARPALIPEPSIRVYGVLPPSFHLISTERRLVPRPSHFAALNLGRTFATYESRIKSDVLCRHDSAQQGASTAPPSIHTRNATRTIN